MTVILTKFHYDSSRIVDFLLIVDFRSCPDFFESVSIGRGLTKICSQMEKNTDNPELFKSLASFQMLCRSAVAVAATR